MAKAKKRKPKVLSRGKTPRPKTKLTHKLRRIRRSNNGVIRVPDGEAEQSWLFNLFAMLIILLLATVIIFFVSGGRILDLMILIKA